MGEDGRAVAFDMLVEPDTGTGLGQDRCERGLADLERIAAQVVAVQLDQVEMTASGQTRDLKKAVEAATVSGLIP
jgi:hypothetical protein